MALGSTQPLVKMSTRNIPGGKGGRCVRLTTSPPSRAECHEIWEPKTSWNPLGHTEPVTGILYLYLTINMRARGGVVVKALRYKPAGRGFDSNVPVWWSQGDQPEDSI